MSTATSASEGKGEENYRGFVLWLNRIFCGNRLEASTWFLTRSIFIRTVALIYLVAFVSFWSQVNGLIGSRGILPASQTMQAVANQVNAAAIKLDRYHVFPTLCWFNQSDRFLEEQCALGTVLACAVFVGIAPAPCLIVLWLTYLSLCTISREFLGFQWDNLLLETGFLAVFFAPIGFLPWKATESAMQGKATPSRIILWLIRWLLFRLMFESGWVKLLSHDETWSHLTALTFHYETQPLPTWIGWYAHQMPIWVHQVSCFLMFSVELLLPFFIFGPRVLRQLAGIIFTLFQASIFLTGNYCFFNLLTMALCLVLFDDQALRVLPGALRRKFKLLRSGEDVVTPGKMPLSDNGVCLSSREAISGVSIGQEQAAGFRSPDVAATEVGRTSRIEEAQARRKPSRIVRLTMNSALAILLLVLTVPQLVHMFADASRPRRPFNSIEEWFAPFRTFNSYGLFAVMTRPRYEIIVQGSNDGQNWLDYEFKYKPGAPLRRPGFVAPHQPRLDWQMWFAALGSYQSNPWFVRFCGQLLQNSPEVLVLLEKNPFAEAPPRYLRAMLYEYHFTDWTTRRKTGAWWRREIKGEYLPAISLRAAAPAPPPPAHAKANERSNELATSCVKC